MPQVPNLIKEYVSNAEYYLTAEKTLPYRKFLAAHILLLLISWENMQIAKEELRSLVKKIILDKELYKSHNYKLREVKKSMSIDRIILGKPGTKPTTTSYSTGRQLEKLLKLCKYGSNGSSKKLSSIFETGWFFRDFRDGLIIEIEWVNTAIKIYES